MANNTLTRATLSELLIRQAQLTGAEAAQLVDAFFDEIAKSLECGEAVKLSSFGTFSVRQKKERVGRNPKTKVEVPINARKVISFRASSLLRKKVNG